jgi:hypothetical protein
VTEHPADAPRLRAPAGEGFACDEDDTGHLVETHRHFHGYRADCACGWTGAYHQRWDTAVREGEAHLIGT